MGRRKRRDERDPQIVSGRLIFSRASAYLVSCKSPGVACGFAALPDEQRAGLLLAGVEGLSSEEEARPAWGDYRRTYRPKISTRRNRGRQRQGSAAPAWQPPADVLIRKAMRMSWVEVSQEADLENRHAKAADRSAALLRRAAVYADPDKIKDSPEPGLPHWSTQYEQPFDPLKPEARLARALVELEPRHASAPQIGSQHGVLPLQDAPERSRAAGSGATNSSPICSSCVNCFTQAGDLIWGPICPVRTPALDLFWVILP